MVLPVDSMLEYQAPNSQRSYLVMAAGLGGPLLHTPNIHSIVSPHTMRVNQ